MWWYFLETKLLKRHSARSLRFPFYDLWRTICLSLNNRQFRCWGLCVFTYCTYDDTKWLYTRLLLGTLLQSTFHRRKVPTHAHSPSVVVIFIISSDQRVLIGWATSIENLTLFCCRLLHISQGEEFFSQFNVMDHQATAALLSLLLMLSDSSRISCRK